ncbi:hypothetical protein ACNFCJ_21025 [Pseudomonas sp. NY15364]|uniref:hypothetical protein n=1 Tax=Pseudomonas sp. NY15364 TaxID=3400353 RepID=UPI003A895D86
MSAALRQPMFHLQPDHFLETTDGQNWLTGAVDDLIEDTLYIDSTRVVDQVSQLEDKIATHVTDKYNEGHDYDGALGQVLRNVLAGDIDKANAALRLLITKDEVLAMAEELVRQLAQVYADSLEDDHE